MGVTKTFECCCNVCNSLPVLFFTIYMLSQTNNIITIYALPFTLLLLITKSSELVRHKITILKVFLLKKEKLLH